MRIFKKQKAKSFSIPPLTQEEDLFNFLPLPICFFDLNGKVLKINPTFEEISGYKKENILGKTIEKFFRKNEIRRIKEETLEKGSVKGRETTFFARGNKEVPISLFTLLSKNRKGEIKGVLLGFYDLTEIKKRETELKEVRTALLNILEDIEEERKKTEAEKNKTLAIITHFADGILVFDKEDRLSLLNPKVEEIFEVKSKEILNLSLSQLSKFPNFLPLLELLKKKEKELFRKELKLRENLILEVSVIPIKAKSEIIGTLVVLHDVTRKKIIERMKTEFVSIAAHQLRTPLSAIKWTLKMLLDGDLGEITEEQREFVNKAYRANERMIKLINDLLNVARIEEGRYLYKLSSLSIEPLVRKIVESLKQEAERKKIKLEFKKPKKKLPKLMLDAEKISLAIQNLVENAIKYTPAGGKVTVSLKVENEEVVFSVKDTGVGIPKEQQDRVFSKFFRGANVMRMETEGSGLGLFITKNIIEAHGGRIWFQSKEGKGTTFYFAIPFFQKVEHS